MILARSLSFALVLLFAVRAWAAPPADATRAPAAPTAPPSSPAPTSTATPAPNPHVQNVITVAPPSSGLRFAIDELKVQGQDIPPALVLQLQDGFVIGLVREGVAVVDPDDVYRRLKKSPELIGCEASPCLKKLGHALDVRYVLRVRVDIVGNSYKMAARLFGTEGSAPAALPVDTQSRFCDVCTVAEARETMIRLASAISAAAHEAPPPAPPPPPPPAPRSQLGPLAAVLVGVAAVGGGAAVLALSGDRDKGLHAVGGALMGAGALGTVVGFFTLFEPPAPTLPPARGLALALRF